MNAGAAAVGPHQRAIAIASGKGGVGKSSVSLNLAIAWGEMGHRVLVVDADFGLGSLDVLVDAIPDHNLADWLGDRATLGQATVRVSDGVDLLAAGSGLWELASLSGDGVDDAIRRMVEASRPYNIVLIDTGAGVGPQVLGVLRAASEIAVVTTPEPTAVTEAYTLIKAVRHVNPAAGVYLLVNQASETAAHEAMSHLGLVCQRFLGWQPLFAGWIPADFQVGAAVAQRRPLLSVYPQAPASRALRAIAQRLLTSEQAAYSLPSVLGRVWLAAVDEAEATARPTRPRNPAAPDRAVAELAQGTAEEVAARRTQPENTRTETVSVDETAEATAASGPRPSGVVAAKSGRVGKRRPVEAPAEAPAEQGAEQPSESLANRGQVDRTPALLDKVPFVRGERIEVTVGDEHYLTWVDDRQESQVRVAAPIRRGHYAQVDTSAPMRVDFHKESAMYEFRAHLVGAAKEGFWVLELETKGTRWQRREHVRWKCTKPVRFSWWGSVGVEGWSARSGTGAGHGRSEDISGGGMLLVTEAELPVGCAIDAEIDLGHRTVAGSGRVLRLIKTEPQAKGNPEHWYGIEWTGMSAADRDAVVKFIYAEQRRALQRGLL